MARGRFLQALIFLLPLAIALSNTHSLAAADAGRGAKSPPIDVLDGKQYSGKLVPKGESTGPADDFVFADGKFYSRACLEWGFDPGPYWVRSENGRLHFLARLTSEENGVMTYRGIVDGSKLDARVEWIKPRWYWNMERGFSFEGARKNQPDPEATGKRE